MTVATPFHLDTKPSSTLPSHDHDEDVTAADACSRPGSWRGSSPTSKLSTEMDTCRPQDFDGEVATTDELPSHETLARIGDYVVLDQHGKSHAFRSLYSGHNVARRVLVVFVRHFFCGNCQEFLRSLSESVTPEALLALPVSTFVAVVGCGDPGLIDMYIAETGCQFPIYTDPTHNLFKALGMVRTLTPGPRPAYTRRSMAKIIVDGIVQGVKQIPKGLVARGGDQRQVGGEFLFEPETVSTPLVWSKGQDYFPETDAGPRRAGGRDKEADRGEEKDAKKEANEDDDEDNGPIEKKRVTWCHRMRTTRDHAEVPELMEILGLDGQGQPIKDKKRWSRAVGLRKGTGASLAAEMSELSIRLREAEEEKERHRAEAGDVMESTI